MLKELGKHLQLTKFKKKTSNKRSGMTHILNIDGLNTIPVEDISKDIMKSSNDIRSAILTKNRKFLFFKMVAFQMI